MIRPNNNKQKNALKSNCDLVILSGGMGSGKAQSVDSKVLTPEGWTTIGSLKVGTLIMNPSGRAQKVIAIYEQGMRECVELEFSDGSKCECDYEHLWLSTLDHKNGDVYKTSYLLSEFDMGITVSVPVYKKKYKSVELTSYKSVGKKECRCIAVDNPNRLYITNDYIVTHNTYIECYMNALNIYKNPSFRATIIRKNISQFFDNGGVADTFQEIYPLEREKSKSSFAVKPIGEIITSPQKMGVYFRNGSRVLFKQINDENPEKLKDQFKGVQSNVIIMDEADAFDFNTAFYIVTRLRGSGEGKRQMICAQNPERDSWVRTFCSTKWNGIEGGGWIGEDGYVIEEMNGVVRYFYMVDGTMRDIIWGKSKEEVYSKAKRMIDEKIRLSGSANIKYENFIKSCVFWELSIFDNKDQIERDPGYIGSLHNSVAGGSALYPNWNYSSKSKSDKVDDSEVTEKDIRNMFRDMPNQTEDIYLVCDPATSGIDNFTIAAFRGFHCIDFWYEEITDPELVPSRIRDMQRKWHVPNQRVIIDANAGFRFISHLFKGAIFYDGRDKAKKNSEFSRKRDEASYRLCQMIKRGIISFNQDLQYLEYTHQKMRRRKRTLYDVLIDESKCLVFEKSELSKIKVLGKAVQSSVIGGMSTDVTDLLVMLVSYNINRVERLLADCENGDFNISDALRRISGEPEEFDKNMIYIGKKQEEKTKNIAKLLNKKLGW